MGEIRDRKVREFILKVKKKFKPEKIILFGSRARGDALEDSDWDFLIVSKTFKNVPFIRRLEAVYEFWDAKQRADVLCYTPEEFEKKKKEISIVKKAVKEGKEIKA